VIMRRFLGPTLVGLGSFLFFGALLMKFFVYPSLAVAPVDPDSVTELTAENVTLFDTSRLETVTTDLAIVSRTVGDVAATQEAPDGTRVWISTTSVRNADGDVVSRSAERIPMDARTAEAKDWGDSWTERVQGERVETVRNGHVLKFPFGTEKTTYDFWDSTAGAAFPAVYDRTEKVDGLTTYVFVQEIPDTVVGTRDVPGSILGLEDPTVTADVHYANTRTLWIEPQTGATVDRTDDQRQWLTAEGAELTVQEGLIRFTDDQVAKNASDLSSTAPLLAGIQGTYPLLTGILGLLLAAGGIGLQRRRAAVRSSDA